MQREYMKFLGVKVLENFGNTPEEQIAELGLVVSLIGFVDHGYATTANSGYGFKKVEGGGVEILRRANPGEVEIPIVTCKAVDNSSTKGRVVYPELSNSPDNPEAVVLALKEYLLHRVAPANAPDLQQLRPLYPEPEVCYSSRQYAPQVRLVSAEWREWYRANNFPARMEEMLRDRVVASEFSQDDPGKYECALISGATGQCAALIYRVERTQV